MASIMTISPSEVPEITAPKIPKIDILADQVLSNASFTQELLARLREQAASDPERILYYWKCAMKAAQADGAPAEPPIAATLNLNADGQDVPMAVVVGHVRDRLASMGHIRDPSESGPAMAHLSVTKGLEPATPLVSPQDCPRPSRFQRIKRRVKAFVKKHQVAIMAVTALVVAAGLGAAIPFVPFTAVFLAYPLAYLFTLFLTLVAGEVRLE